MDDEMNEKSLLEIASEIETTQTDDDFDKVWKIVNFFESTHSDSMIYLPLQYKLVRLLMSKYLESELAYASYLWMIGKAHPITFIRPICRLVAQYGERILEEPVTEFSGRAFSIHQLLIVIQNFQLGYYKNPKVKRTLRRKYMQDFLQRSTHSINEQSAKISQHICNEVFA